MLTQGQHFQRLGHSHDAPGVEGLGYFFCLIEERKCAINDDEKNEQKQICDVFQPYAELGPGIVARWSAIAKIRSQCPSSSYSSVRAVLIY